MPAKRTRAQTQPPATVPKDPADTPMRVAYGPDDHGRVCGRCYFHNYRELPISLKKRQAYPNVYACVDDLYPDDTPACKLWRQAPEEFLK